MNDRVRIQNYLNVAKLWEDLTWLYSMIVTFVINGKSGTGTQNNNYIRKDEVAIAKEWHLGEWPYQFCLVKAQCEVHAKKANTS